MARVAGSKDLSKRRTKSKKPVEIQDLSLDFTTSPTVWKFLQDDSPLVQYAKEQDCVRIEAIVRDGFIKVLCKYGFKKTATLVNKILKEK